MPRYKGVVSAAQSKHGTDPYAQKKVTVLALRTGVNA